MSVAPTGQGPAFWAIWREAGLAHDALVRRRTTIDAPTPAELRDQVLHAMGAWQDGDDAPLMADPDVLKLLDAFEGALREAWEAETRITIEQQARAAIRRSLDSIVDGRLL